MHGKGCTLFIGNNSIFIYSHIWLFLSHSYEGLALYRLSFLWYSAVCFLVTFVVGLLVSILFPGRSSNNI